MHDYESLTCNVQAYTFITTKVNELMNHNGGPYIPTQNGRKYHVSRLPFSRPHPRAGPSRPKRLEEQRLLPQRQESKGRRFLVLKGHDKGRLLGLVAQKNTKGEA